MYFSIACVLYKGATKLFGAFKGIIGTRETWSHDVWRLDPNQVCTKFCQIFMQFGKICSKMYNLEPLTHTVTVFSFGFCTFCVQLFHILNWSDKHIVIFSLANLYVVR